MTRPIRFVTDIESCDEHRTVHLLEGLNRNILIYAHLESSCLVVFDTIALILTTCVRVLGVEVQSVSWWLMDKMENKMYSYLGSSAC